MKHRIPLVISLACNLAGIALWFFDFGVVAQSFFALAFFMGIAAFKKRAGLAAAIAHAIPGFILAALYYKTGTFPFVTVAVLIAAIQNPFLETFFPSKMHHVTYFRVILGGISVVSYFIGNLIYPAGWQAWVFPGTALLIANTLSVLITYDMILINKFSVMGYLKNGQPCPDFNLPDENGAPVTKKDFEGKFLLLIFVRGDWCPGCHIMLRTYNRHKEKFAERGVNLLSIGPDPLGVNKEMVQKLGLHYHILSDDKQMLAKQFCVELPKTIPGAPAFDFIPLPASFLIDKEGIVRYTSRADKAGEILNPEQIFAVLDSLK